MTKNGCWHSCENILEGTKLEILFVSTTTELHNTFTQTRWEYTSALAIVIRVVVN